MREVALGNPLLNKKDYTIKRRWDDDVVFKNQARGTEVKKPKEFTNVSFFSSSPSFFFSFFLLLLLLRFFSFFLSFLAFDFW